MSFRERMRVSPSNAEIAVRLACQARGLHPVTDYEICLLWTYPDLTFFDSRTDTELPVYLDGLPVHNKVNVTVRDLQINELLMKLKIPPLRIRYKPPLSKKRCNAIVNIIEETLQQPLKWIKVEEV